MRVLDSQLIARKSTLQHRMLSLLPEKLASRLQVIRSRNHQVRYLRKEGVLDLNKRYVEAFGLTVRTGPFAGMQYPASAAKKRHVIPRLLGSYEACLHSIVLDIRHRRYERIIDIGCGEGYYAVGLALMCPDTAVFAFDAEWRELQFCEQMRDLNGAANLTVASFCAPDTLLANAATYRSLILSDCEGYEAKLFTDETTAALRHSDFLIELHEDASPGVTSRIASLLRKTHDVALVDFAPPPLRHYPELETLGERAELCLCEFRKPWQQWLYAVSVYSSSN